MAFKFNPITATLDLIGTGGVGPVGPTGPTGPAGPGANFNTIVTSSLTPFGNPITMYDVVATLPGYAIVEPYEDQEVVIDSNGNVVTT